MQKTERAAKASNASARKCVGSLPGHCFHSFKRMKTLPGSKKNVAVQPHPPTNKVQTCTFQITLGGGGGWDLKWYMFAETPEVEGGFQFSGPRTKCLVVLNVDLGLCHVQVICSLTFIPLRIRMCYCYWPSWKSFFFLQIKSERILDILWVFSINYSNRAYWIWDDYSKEAHSWNNC